MLTGKLDGKNNLGDVSLDGIIEIKMYLIMCSVRMCTKFV